MRNPISEIGILTDLEYSAIISVGLLRLANVLFNGNDIFCVNSTSSPAKNNCIFILNNVYFVRQLSEPLMKD